MGAQGVGIAMFAGALALAAGISWAMRFHSKAPTFTPILPAASAALVAAALGWFVAKGVQPPLLGLVVSTIVSLAAYGIGLMVVRRSDALRVARMVAEVVPLHRLVRSRPFAVGS
jgi:hypothetical protein